MNYLNLKEECTIKLFRTESDIKEYSEQIINLVNSSYDKPESWTDKIQVLEINRLNIQELEQLTHSDNKLLFFIIDNISNNIYGCIEIYYEEKIHEFDLDVANFGISLFAVNYMHQSKGIGKYLLNFSEMIIKFIYYCYKKIDINDLLININSIFTYGFEIKDTIAYFKKDLSNNLEYIYIMVIYAKKDLYNFYSKYGYDDTKMRVSLKDVLKNITLFIESEFALLRKKIF